MSNPNLAEARAKAQISPRTGKRGPDKLTLLKEKALEEAFEGLKKGYRRRLVKRFPSISEVNLKVAELPRGWPDRKFVMEQVMGKPIEHQEPQKHLHLHADLDIERVKKLAERIGEFIEQEDQ